MMKKRVIDLSAACVCLAVLGIAWLYPDQIQWRGTLLWSSGILCICFLVLAAKDRNTGQEAAGRTGKGLPSDKQLVTEIVLLSEEDTELALWDIYGKTAMVIGRDVRGNSSHENQVDIDLSQGPFASMVDVEHAVLNYSAGNWYVEDLGSANGISVKKADGKVYKLSPDNPCRLERGDCLNVGLNRLLLR